MAITRWRTLFALVGALALAVSPALGQEPPGRVGGRVIDASNARPLPLAGVLVVEPGVRTVTDADGRYRTPPLPPGSYTLRIELLGYAVAEQRAEVEAGQAIVLDFALVTQALAIGGITIEVEATGQTGTVDALLAAQRAAPSLSDGISAEQISRSVSSDAGDAISRVTGVSVVDGRFVVVRGLSERYSSTMLNGAELASPEPTKRIVPLDVFPASLLESVVTTKTATPDRPGDFAGGSVDIKTKEFPDERVLEVKFSQGFDDLATFRELPFTDVSGRDHLAFDGQDRAPSSPLSEEASFAKTLRSDWTPPVQRVMPDLGLGFTLGDQVGEFERALGYVVSFDYGSSRSYDPSRYFAFVDDVNDGSFLAESVTQQSTTTVDWGGVANLAWRLGPSHSLTLKNLVTREAEERFTTQLGFDPEIQAGNEFGDRVQALQSRYLTRTLVQSQLGGRHFLDAALGSTLEWKGSVTYAGRDEPENRTVNRIFNDVLGQWEVHGTQPNPYWYRYLDEFSYSGQFDWLAPFSLKDPGDLQVKVGGLVRLRRREFEASLYNVIPPTRAPDGRDVFALSPDLLITPENLGRNLLWADTRTVGLPYDASDDIYAGYAMLDVAPVERLRLVGGVRAEQWRLLVEVPQAQPQVRDELDLLWSANMTYRLSDRMNLRAAGFRTVSRPDPRELSTTTYSEVSNECVSNGNPFLQRAQILNGDVRWEWFPNPGELLSVTGFWKRFEDPFITIVNVRSLKCNLRPANADQAYNYGGEFEVRKNLGFLTDHLSSLDASVNVTYTDGRVIPKESNGLGDEELPLIDQSDWLVNAALTWRVGDFEASVLGQSVGDRVRRYGDTTNDPTTLEPIRTPDSVELGRTTFDAKVSRRFGALTVSASGTNLTGEPVQAVQPTTQAGDVPTLYETGVRSFSLGFTYRIW